MKHLYLSLFSFDEDGFFVDVGGSGRFDGGTTVVEVLVVDIVVLDIVVVDIVVVAVVAFCSTKGAVAFKGVVDLLLLLLLLLKEEEDEEEEEDEPGDSCISALSAPLACGLRTFIRTVASPLRCNGVCFGFFFFMQ